MPPEDSDEEPKQTMLDPGKLHIVHFSPIITEPSVAALIHAIEFLMSNGAHRICLAISSNGGSMKDAFEVHNYLKSLHIDELQTHNVGTVGSAAIMPFVAGSVRYASRNSGFMIHGPNIPLSGAQGVTLTRPLIDEYGDSAKSFHRQMAVTVANETKLSIADVMAMMGDTHFTPAQAKKLGVTHGTREFRREKGAKYIHISSEGTGAA